MSKSFQNVSRICHHLREPFGRVYAAIKSLEMQPELRLNGTAHYSDEQVEQIKSYLVGRPADAGGCAGPSPGHATASAGQTPRGDR
jgi:hypothetical protein